MSPKIVRSYVPQHLDRASILLWFGFSLFFTIVPLFPLFFAIFPLFPLFFSILLLGSFVFPLLSLSLCLVPPFPLYFMYLFLLTLSTIYWSYIRTVSRFLCIRSFTGRPILRRISILTRLHVSTFFCQVKYLFLLLHPSLIIRLFTHKKKSLNRKPSISL